MSLIIGARWSVLAVWVLVRRGLPNGNPVRCRTDKYNIESTYRDIRPKRLDIGIRCHAVPGRCIHSHLVDRDLAGRDVVPGDGNGATGHIGYR